MVNDDLSIFSADPELTALPLLSLPRLHAGLANSVPKNMLDAPISSYQISNLRYSPRKKMVVGMTSPNSEKPISLRIFPARRLHDKLKEAQSSHPRHAFLVKDLDAIAWVYPGERKLNLEIVNQSAQLSNLLRSLRGYHLRHLELMHFVPEHTYTARIHGVTEDGRQVREYLKVYEDDTGAKTALAMERIAEQLTASPITLPNDVTYLANHRMLIQSEVLQNKKNSLSMDTAAFALAKFHSLDFADAEVSASNAEVDHSAALAIVKDVFPQLYPTIESLSALILTASRYLEDAPFVLLHGDAHLGNIFNTVDGRVAFIDLDRVRRGPAEEDLASFLAFKAWLQVRENKDPELVLLQIPQFVHAYNVHALSTVNETSLYIRLADKMLTERIRRGIVRGKLSGISEIAIFEAFARQCIVKAGVCDV